MNRIVWTVCAAVAALIFFNNPGRPAEKNPDVVLTFDWNNPAPAVMEAFAQRVQATIEHNAKVLQQRAAPALTQHADVNRALKGDRLPLKAPVVKDRELADGTPLEEVEVHEQEINDLPPNTTRIAKQ